MKYKVTATFDAINEAMALVNALACPHTRGDDPKSNYILTHELNLSPHAWG